MNVCGRVHHYKPNFRTVGRLGESKMILVASDELPRPTKSLCVTRLEMLLLLLLLFLSMASFVSPAVGRSADYRSVVNLSSFDRVNEQILIIRDWHDSRLGGTMPSTHFPTLMNKEHN